MLLDENKKLFKEVNDDILDGLDELTATRTDATEVRVHEQTKDYGVKDKLVTIGGWAIVIAIGIFVYGLLG